ncbi:LysM-like peptidoglycan-binding domain-containing protein [Erwinia sp. HR93]|uniref:LysM-like peptidoglycan-binding domain-containing protein n=1 Tax=Erwinia sp. HR93 TaxID=3094840 RepID=UPI002ADEF47B|nr:LysM-like peptidoglycan-binding domain-containing protein [Erwinia sp. HR93]MEA1063352.1 LysM-like peptidoglycan-binding domain-containing protein [Erwinia sp. HR93]
MPTRFVMTPLLARIWHAPANIRLMDPLPIMHRRGIILGALLIVIGVLLPSDEDTRHSRAPVNAPARSAATPDTPQQSHQAPVPFQDNDIQAQWRAYQVEPGKTLAQIFRDHNLPPADAYEMAKIDGTGNPLSHLQTGQWVKIRQNASGIITGLTLEGSGENALFTRQPEGHFLRVH